MFVVTGAGGFIGSVMVGYLNQIGCTDVIAVDDLNNPEQYKNLKGKKFTLLSQDEIENLIAYHKNNRIQAVFHFGAISDTLHKDWPSMYHKNVQSTRKWTNFCLNNNIPLIFASTAAIYGNGDGPLNQYAFSKEVSEQEISKTAACLRLFNVYGPNEYHKGRMASTILHWYNQIQDTGSIKIFKDSDQYYRDFIWVEDVCRAFYHFYENFQPGIYDLGTGRSESFERVARELEKHVAQDVYFNYIDMPSDLAKQYQTDTKANTDALTKTGFDVTLCRSLAEGIEDYVQFLKNGTYL